VAYTWFNRIVALRYMDLRGYNKVRIVSPQAGQVQPELLYQIKQGRTPKQLHSLQETFNAYLEGTIRTDQPDREIYTAALLGMCNAYTEMLPFLFRRVDDYMAVLLPTDLLSENSIIADVQEAIGEDEVEDVEVIGWLYQFYISEKKDQVFARPKGEKIKKEDIPAATQLFTPHWIVRYMVENSLGRLWRNNFPDTRVSEQMDYYIEGDPEPDYLKISGPEEITLLDPACGSGHILTYAFDLLYAMYEEAGYTPSEIPSLILRNNLYGIDIDTRAAELAAFALTMKAREKDRFFFQRGVEPNVIAMEDVTEDLRETGITMSPQLRVTFGYLSEATNFGSLIPVPSEVHGEIDDILAELDTKDDADLFADRAVAQVRSGVRQLGYLARRYHCLVTNPPYVGSRHLNSSLKHLASEHFKIAKSDVYSMMWMRVIALTKGLVAIVTQRNWFYQAGFESFREYLLKSTSLFEVFDVGPGAFESLSGEIVQLAVAIQRTAVSTSDHKVKFRYKKQKTPNGRSFAESESISVRQHDFLSLPSHSISYRAISWLNWLLSEDNALKKVYVVWRQGLSTGSDERFIRYWFEVDGSSFATGAKDRNQVVQKKATWVPIDKGGKSRRWYGNNEKILRYDDEAYSILLNSGNRLPSKRYYFQPGLTWTKISGSSSAVRYDPAGFVFSSVGMKGFAAPDVIGIVASILNSRVATYFFQLISGGLSLLSTDLQRLPYLVPLDETKLVYARSIAISKLDWDSREISWDFERSPLTTNYRATATIRQIDDTLRGLHFPFINVGQHRLEDRYWSYVDHWAQLFREYHELQEENNQTFIDLYRLGEDLSPEVSYRDLGLLEYELHKNSLQHGHLDFDAEEIMKQFVSYGVGCIFGRYSLDEDGLILANAGDDLDAYLARIPEPRLRPDESGILPITEDDAFPDDLPSQFRDFLRAAFGTERYDENLQFLEEGLGKDLRRYFLKEFYKDHVKRYKKRPIYWLITSPKGSLQALIYLHRYNRDTVNRFLNDYLRPYQRKLEARKRTAEQSVNTGGVSGSERTRARKEIDQISTALEELSLWERDVVRPLAEQRVELDLDDGVKVNYGKLGAILETVKGLNA